MANRETYPASLFPLRGDVSAEAGAISVKVTGLQGTPLTPTAPVNAQAPVYVSADGLIEWKSLDTSILIEGVPISDDYDIGVELTLGTTVSPVLVEGT